MERVVLLKICMSKQFLETLFYFVNGWLRFLLPRRRLSATDVRSSYDPFSPATAPPFLGPKLLGLRIVPSLGLLSLSGTRQPLCSQFWQLPNTFMVRKCSLANIGALTFTSKVSCWSLIWFSSMSSLSSGGPLFSLSRTEYQAGRECPISRFGEMFRSLRRKKPCRHQPQVANDSGYQAESSL